MGRDSKRAGDLALFGGEPRFTRPRSTSGLWKPAFDRFMHYSKLSFDGHWYTNNGPANRLLEERLAAFHDVTHCVAFSSGFWGLVLAIRCLALPGRDEIVMPSLTYRRMADAVAWSGLIPRFCEVDEDSLAASPATIEPLLADETALILAAQPIVNCCDAVGLEALGRAYGLPLLIDSVESMYESIYGRRVGTFGNAELFSLHASKLLNGMEGGYVTTDDPELARRLKLMRAFGFEGQDNVVTLGLNAKLNEIHAAMALASLDCVEDTVEHNRSIYRAYQNTLPDLPGIRLLPFDETERCGYKNVVVELCEGWPLDRAGTVSLLNAENILARAYYSPPLHMKATSYPTRGNHLPVTERLSERFVLLPCGYQVDSADVEEIVDVMHCICRNAGELRSRLV